MPFIKSDTGQLKNIVQLEIATNSSDTLRMIPYYAWNNRGNGAMKLWFDQEK